MSMIDLTSAEFRKNAQENYLVSHFSISAVGNFQRHPFDYARKKIYHINRPSTSISNACGRAYDKALQHFFQKLMDGELTTLGDMLFIAEAVITSTDDNYWKQTTKSIEEMKTAAIKKATFAITSFLKESEQYTDEIQEVLFIDQLFSVEIKINGVDIPLPFYFVPDLIYINKKGELCVLDHKCVGAYTKNEDISFKYGNQTIGYFLGVNKLVELNIFKDWIKKYPKIKEGVKNFYFYENKNSSNSRGVNVGKSQIQKIPAPDAKETRKLLELLLYESTRELINAVGDPDYVYIINPSDMFCNTMEILDDWIAIQTLEVDCFDLNDPQKELLQKRKKQIRDADLKNIPAKVIANFKDYSANFVTLSNMENKTPEEKIQIRLQSLGIIAKVVHTISSYNCTTYLLQAAAGQRIDGIRRAQYDIAVALGSESVYIPKDLQRHEGGSYVQVQVPVLERKFVSHPAGASGLNVELGLDNFGSPLCWDLESPSTPNGIISGAVGSGKSVCLSTILKSVKGHYDELYILDPKYEFDNSINDMKEIENTVEMLVEKMNTLIKNKKKHRVIIVFDELADALQSSKSGKDLEIRKMVQVGEYRDGRPKMKNQKVGMKKSLAENLQLLLQKGRSTGFNIIAATQRASAKVLSGDALVNFPVRIAFRTPKAIDSQVILGETGAEKLLGKGDGLFLSGEVSSPTRFQGYFE